MEDSFERIARLDKKVVELTLSNIELRKEIAQLKSRIRRPAYRRGDKITRKQIDIFLDDGYFEED